ncbi:MAG: Wzz/FepE/Etk N-terminal domain-containing protein, partial [Parabacteroides sp.]
MVAENETNRLQQEGEMDLNLGDMLRILRVNWYWFLSSVVVCVALGVLYLAWAPKVYTRTASVLIKDDSKGGGGISETAAFEELNMFNVKRNVDNEVLVFKSKRLMTEVARRLHLDMSYTIKEGLRTVQLYTQSPVIVSLPDAEENESYSFVVTPVSSKEVRVSDFYRKGELVSDETYKLALGDTLKTPIGRMAITPSLYYADTYFGTDIQVAKSNLETVATGYQTNLQAALASKTSTIINLTLQDVSIARAEDVINTLIAIYNEDAINDKNQVTVNTSNFINERLIIIEKELGNVDANIEEYKREHQLTDITSETGMYLQNTSQYKQEGLSLENQQSLAKYIRDYLQDPGKSQDLIPANTGISDINVESQITEYNNMLLKRDKLISNSSERNPVVQDLNNSLSAMKQTIVRS